MSFTSRVPFLFSCNLQAVNTVTLSNRTGPWLSKFADFTFNNLSKHPSNVLYIVFLKYMYVCIYLILAAYQIIVLSFTTFNSLVSCPLQVL